MNAISVQSVIDALASLEMVNNQEGVEPIANAFMDGDEFALQMNEAAAVYFCRMVLETVTKSFSGAHQHLDEINFVDAGGGRLRIEKVG